MRSRRQPKLGIGLVKQILIDKGYTLSTYNHEAIFQIENRNRETLNILIQEFEETVLASAWEKPIDLKDPKTDLEEWIDRILTNMYPLNIGRIPQR